MIQWLDLQAEAKRIWSIEPADMPSAGECVSILLGIGLVFGLISAVLLPCELRVKTPESG